MKIYQNIINKILNFENVKVKTYFLKKVKNKI